MQRHRFFLVACLLAALLPLLFGAREARADFADFPGWPAEFEGQPLTPLAMEARELAFYERFPGQVARFSDGEREVILRWIAEPTQDLHPAATCFRGRGFEIRHGEGWLDPERRRWGQFEAERESVKFRVRERVFSAERSWSDVSAWYWAASLGSSPGPYWAVMVAERSL